MKRIINHFSKLLILKICLDRSVENNDRVKTMGFWIVVEEELRESIGLSKKKESGNMK
jgi:hypothetical protein